MAQDEAPILNPLLNPGVLQGDFQRDGRIHVRDLLAEKSATRLSRCLESETDYRLAIHTATGMQRVKPGVTLRPEQEASMTRDAYAAARDKFQYLYGSHPMSDQGEPYPDSDHYLATVMRFLSGAAFLDFARCVTGLADIAYADAQATQYGPGHFLTLHNDEKPADKRLAAYVLNMTPDWRIDWGGLLLFPDAQGHIEGGYAPAYNALNIFRVPRLHLVSMVMPFAPRARHSITGWLRAR